MEIRAGGSLATKWVKVRTKKRTWRSPLQAALEGGRGGMAKKGIDAFRSGGGGKPRIRNGERLRATPDLEPSEKKI